MLSAALPWTALQQVKANLNCYSEKPRPNIIFILADDQGWGDIGRNGNPNVETPVLDRFAEEGTVFNHFYASPLSSPSRASFLTGRHFLRTGVQHVKFLYDVMRSEETTIAEILKAHGYATGCFGKWHNGAHYPNNPNGQGFDEFIGFYSGAVPNYFDRALIHNNMPIETKGYITDVLTDKALEFIRNHSTEPFFCYLPYNVVHDPFQVPDRYFSKYKNKGLPDDLACIYAECENLDDNIGRILSELEQMNIRNNTIVVYSSDNGANTDRYDGYRRGIKGSLHEGGCIVPFFIQWPGHIVANRQINHIAAHIDLLPTLLELANITPVPGLKPDGRSFAKTLLRKQDTPDSRCLYEHLDGLGAVRSPQYRLIIGDSLELYDLSVDSSETQNIARKHPEITNSLLSGYIRWLADVTAGGFDYVPIEIGNEKEPIVELQIWEALEAPVMTEPHVHGTDPRRGWAYEPLDKWTTVKGRITWLIEVVEPGEYEVSLKYGCKPGNEGAMLMLQADSSYLMTTVDKVHDAVRLPQPDRVSAPGPGLFDWGMMHLGTLQLRKGQTTLTLRALSMPGTEVVSMQSLIFRKTDQKNK